MDNPNPTKPAPVDYQNVDAFSQDIGKLKAFAAKVQEGIKQKRELSKQAKQNSTAQTPTGGAQKSTKNIFAGNKVLVIALAVFIFFTILLVSASLYKALSGTKKESTAQASPTPEVNVVINEANNQNLSRYATDSGVVEVSAKIDELEKTMTNTTIQEPQLTLPNLDFSISF